MYICYLIEIFKLFYDFFQPSLVQSQLFNTLDKGDESQLFNTLDKGDESQVIENPNILSPNLTLSQTAEPHPVSVPLSWPDSLPDSRILSSPTITSQLPPSVPQPGTSSSDHLTNIAQEA